MFGNGLSSTASADPGDANTSAVPAAGISATPAGKNLLKSTSDFGADAWSAFKSNATITVNAAKSPDGNQDAARLVVGGFLGQVVPGAIAGHTYVFSSWMKSATGSSQSVMLAGENNPPASDARFTSFAVTPDWQRYFIVFKCPYGGNANFRFSYRTGDIYAWRPQVEDVTGNASQTPTDFADGPGPAPLRPLVLKGPPAPGIVQNIACWGDSLTAGAGGTPYPTDLQADPRIGKRTVLNGGVGGQISSQIKARFLADPQEFGDLTIIWAGRNNYGDPDTIKADIAEMVDRLTTDRFLVLSILNARTEPKGGPLHDTIVKLNRDLADRYKDRYLDVRSALAAAYDKSKPDDVADHDNDVIPSSLRSDGVHLNSAGYRFVANMVLNCLSANKWL